MVDDLARRLVDLTGALVGLIVLFPALFVVGVLIKLDSAGPVLHRAQRTGRAGKPFCLYKFRSMVAGAHQKGPGLTAAGDFRITRLGQILRRTKIDELPQLFNVLKGDMSLVGPRPEDPRYVELYTTAQREVLAVRPGLTGAAALVYRDESSLLSGGDWQQRYVNEILPHKLAIELDYLAHRTVISDLGVILQTVFAAPRREGGTSARPGGSTNAGTSDAAR